MDEKLKQRLFLYYWGLLEGDDLLAIERYLSTPEHQKNYEALTKGFETLFKDPQPVEQKEANIATFQDIKRIYNERVERKIARTEQMMTLVWLGVTIVAAIVVVALLVVFVSSPRYRANLSMLGVDQGIVTVEITGAVELYDVRGREVVLRGANQEIAKGETIVTGEDGAAVIRFGKEIVVGILPNTKVTFKSTRIDNDVFSANISLQSGSMQFETFRDRRASKLFFIETDRMRIEGTTGAFLVSAYPPLERLDALQGRLIAKPIVASISNAIYGLRNISPLHPINRAEFLLGDGSISVFPQTLEIQSRERFDKAVREALTQEEIDEIIKEKFTLD